MEELNDLLLRLGISMTGLAFGMSIPIFARLLFGSLSLRGYRWSKELTRFIIFVIVLSTAFMVIAADHITTRRAFLLIGTTAACVALYLVRNVGQQAEKG